MYLLGAEPEGESVARVECQEERAVANPLTHSLLDSGRVGAVQVGSVPLELDFLGVERGYGADTAEDLRAFKGKIQLERRGRRNEQITCRVRNRPQGHCTCCA